MVKKEELLATLETMPDVFEADELFEKILFLNKVEEGRRQVKDGETINFDEAKEKLRKWLL